MKPFLFPVLAFVLVSCASQGVVPLEVTVTSTPLPTETPLPTATATPVAVDGVADVDGALYIFDETTQAWTELPALEAPYAKVIVDENNKVVAVDAEGEEAYSLDMSTGEWVKKLSETAVAVELEGNPYSGQGIEVTKLNEFTLSQDDLPMMADYLDALAKEGMFDAYFGDPSEVIKLTDFVMSSLDSRMIEGVGWQVAYEVNKSSKSRLIPVENRPRLMAFPFTDGGVLLADMVMGKDGHPVVKDWLWLPDGWMDISGGRDALLNAVMHYGNVPVVNGASYKSTIPIPKDFATVEACEESVKTSSMAGYCEEIVRERQTIMKLHASSIASGAPSKPLRNGEYIIVYSATPLR